MAELTITYTRDGDRIAEKKVLKAFGCEFLRTQVQGSGEFHEIPFVYQVTDKFPDLSEQAKSALMMVELGRTDSMKEGLAWLCDEEEDMMAESYEILGDGLASFFSENNIMAINTYDDGEYEVWTVPKSGFEKMSATKDEDWKDEWGWWRYSDSSNIRAETATVKINCFDIIAFIDEDKKAMYEADDEEYNPSDEHYKNLSEYMSECLQIGQPRNICAVAMHLSKLNGISMGELFRRYEGGNLL